MKYSDMLKGKRAQCLANADNVLKAATAANREMTAEEQTSFDAAMSEHNGYEAKITAALTNEKAIETNAAPRARITENVAVSSDMKEMLAEDPMGGFKNTREYLGTVVKAGFGVKNGIQADERLRIVSAAPSTFGAEGTGADGGWAAPPMISKEIWSFSAIDEDSLINYCDNTPVEGNAMAFPSDEETPWSLNGPRAYWANEASVATPTKPKLGDVTLRLEKLLALVPLTNELLADTTALTAYLPKRIGLSVKWKTNEAILFGNGNGQPLGALNGNATITQAKDSGQATLTLSDTNLANMMAKLPPNSYNKAIWLYNNDCFAPLYTLKNSAGYPVFAPFLQPSGGAMHLSPNVATILGRPAMMSQHANTFSSLGDFMLLDLSYYKVITKSGGLETATSIHFYFDADATAFRTTFRVMGQPAIKNPISPAKGTSKMSPFVQLSAR